MITPGMVEAIRTQLSTLRDAILDRERQFATELSLVHEVHRERARNLVHFLAYRELHVEELEPRLEALGLDPLRDVEWNVLQRTNNVLQLLNEMSGLAGTSPGFDDHTDQPSGREMLRERTDALFGPPPARRDARIMVTLPAESADDPDIIKSYLHAGADCFRINCARDNPEIWKRCIDRIPRTGLDGTHPKIFMDLGGSKLRVSSCAGAKDGIRLERGDTLSVSVNLSPFNSEDGSAGHAIAVSDPSGLHEVSPGHHIWFDDGKIGGIVKKVGAHAIEVEVTYVRKGARRLRLERGVNLPDTMLRLPAMTDKDHEDLLFAVRHADFLALSFVRTSSDVDQFRRALLAATEKPPAMVIKIETREALQNIPRLMLAAMRQERVAMLIARGDLAVECGMLEMPRIQRTMLRYCAAASLPLFWATGVLERMSRTGEPTRAEVTDAAYAGHAQCVMLNKGPGTGDALSFLGTLLERRNESI
jgi:pyruvate kinase